MSCGIRIRLFTHVNHHIPGLQNPVAPALQEYTILPARGLSLRRPHLGVCTAETWEFIVSFML
jgi:hypothetical protein